MACCNSLVLFLMRESVSLAQQNRSSALHAYPPKLLSNQPLFRFRESSCIPRHLVSGALLPFRQDADAQVGHPEIIVLRQQLNVLRRSAPKRPALKLLDRLIFVWLYRLAPSVLDAMTVVRPDTIVRWHRAGFRTFWRSKSRSRAGRPKVPLEVRRLIREMSLANPLWGAMYLATDVWPTSMPSLRSSPCMRGAARG